MVRLDHLLSTEQLFCALEQRARPHVVGVGVPGRVGECPAAGCSGWNIDHGVSGLLVGRGVPAVSASCGGCGGSPVPGGWGVGHVVGS